jgi:hypothetical protein
MTSLTLGDSVSTQGSRWGQDNPLLYVPRARAQPLWLSWQCKGLRISGSTPGHRTAVGATGHRIWRRLRTHNIPTFGHIEIRMPWIQQMHEMPTCESLFLNAWVWLCKLWSYKHDRLQLRYSVSIRAQFIGGIVNLQVCLKKTCNQMQRTLGCTSSTSFSIF